MRKIQLSLLLSLVAFFATGCPNEPSRSFKNKNSFVSNVNDYLTKAQQDYERNVTTNPAEAKRIRDDAIEDAVAVIDSNYSDYISSINSRRSWTDFLADVVDLGVGAATGIAKGERPNQILGIAITAFRGGRRSGELNFYKEQTTPILIAKMDDNRAQIYGAILQNKVKPVNQYSLKEAIRDIVNYYNAGTLIRAFTQLSKDTAASAKQSEDELEEIKKNAGVLGAPSAEEFRTSRQNADAIDALVETFEEANDKVADADKKIAAAEAMITDANNRIDTQSKSPTPNQAEIDKANKDKTDAETAKAEAVKANADATKARDEALSDLKGTYQAIEDDPALSPLLDEIPNLPGFSDSARSNIRQMLQRAKNKAGTVDDYAFILLQMNKVVVRNLTKDPTLNKRLQGILAANKE